MLDTYDISCGVFLGIGADGTGRGNMLLQGYELCCREGFRVLADSLRRLHEPNRSTDEGRLAGAVCADEPQDHALRHGYRDGADRECGVALCAPLIGERERMPLS